mgnify:CR=1 FL=1
MQKDVYWSFGIGMVLAFLVSWALYKTAIMMVMLLVRMAADNPKKLHIKDDMKTVRALFVGGKDALNCCDENRSWRIPL